MVATSERPAPAARPSNRPVTHPTANGQTPSPPFFRQQPKPPDGTKMAATRTMPKAPIAARSVPSAGRGERPPQRSAQPGNLRRRRRVSPLTPTRSRALARPLPAPSLKASAPPLPSVRGERPSPSFRLKRAPFSALSSATLKLAPSEQAPLRARKSPIFGHETALWHATRPLSTQEGARAREKPRSANSVRDESAPERPRMGSLRARTRIAGQKPRIFAHAKPAHTLPLEGRRTTPKAREQGREHEGDGEESLGAPRLPPATARAAGNPSATAARPAPAATRSRKDGSRGRRGAQPLRIAWKIERQFHHRGFCGIVYWQWTQSARRCHGNLHGRKSKAWLTTSTPTRADAPSARFPSRKPLSMAWPRAAACTCPSAFPSSRSTMCAPWPICRTRSARRASTGRSTSICLRTSSTS